jgi:hypothetical protein
VTLGWQYRAGLLSKSVFRANALSVFTPYIWIAAALLIYHLVRAAVLLHRETRVDSSPPPSQLVVLTDEHSGVVSTDYSKVVTHIAAGAICLLVVSACVLLLRVASPFVRLVETGAQTAIKGNPQPEIKLRAEKPPSGKIPQTETHPGQAERGLPTSPQQFAFREGIPETVAVLLDNGANFHIEMNLHSAAIQKGKSAALLKLDGEELLRVYIEDGIFYVDASITDGHGHQAIQIKKNKLEVRPSAWDRNFSANAIEVVDSNQRPVFQMIRKRANLIQINGLFVSSKGSVLDMRPLKALFRYPSWKHQGEYAEENPTDSTMLSGLTNAELLSQTEALCRNIRSLGSEWDQGYFKNNADALGSINAAKSKEQKEHYSRQRMADNEHLYLELKARYNKEYGQRARELEAVLVQRINSPADVFNPASVPSLLKSGIAAGPNPFNEVADYLESLARRLP